METRHPKAHGDAGVLQACTETSVSGQVRTRRVQVPAGTGTRRRSIRKAHRRSHAEGALEVWCDVLGFMIKVTLGDSPDRHRGGCQARTRPSAPGPGPGPRTFFRLPRWLIKPLPAKRQLAAARREIGSSPGYKL